MGEEKFVLVTGNLSEGYRVFGPFDSFDAAAAADVTMGGWVMTLEPPDSVGVDNAGKESGDANDS